MARGEIAGAVVLASRHDQVAQLACIGPRDIEAGLPMEPDTIFRIASMTKPVTSVGALKLVEAGKLHLDDPVSRFIPEFADLAVFAGVEDGRVRLAPLERPITIQHLLTHTSGLFGVAPDLDPRVDLRQSRRLPLRPTGAHAPARRAATGPPTGSRLAVRLVA